VTNGHQVIIAGWEGEKRSCVGFTWMLLKEQEQVQSHRKHRAMVSSASKSPSHMCRVLMGPAA